MAIRRLTPRRTVSKRHHHRLDFPQLRREVLLLSQIGYVVTDERRTPQSPWLDAKHGSSTPRAGNDLS